MRPCHQGALVMRKILECTAIPPCRQGTQSCSHDQYPFKQDGLYPAAAQLPHVTCLRRPLKPASPNKTTTQTYRLWKPLIWPALIQSLLDTDRERMSLQCQLISQRSSACMQAGRLLCSDEVNCYKLVDAMNGAVPKLVAARWY